MTRRRTFLTLLGAAAVASAAGTGTAEETDSEEVGETSGELEPAEALLAYVVANYGDRLDDEDRDVIREGIEGSLASADAFGDVGLENADEPAYGFSAYRGDRP
ncbi:hypothetical protein QA600_18690 [Natronococcus sp. A-GB1]|uniref:hypothetical protein n=1 Tax=Natronococcus sp. A-GB1 TaxID=3037648 RepID=UPI00241D7FAA|nr:hypothetical protein [Natronococcus sp. A-GB1]MDG5761361.1 hypothetical protein [Natronococcus sp. A-GB1]